MAEIPTIASPALPTEHRKKTQAPLLRAELAGLLRRLAEHIARDELAAGTATGAVVVVLTDGQPVVTWGDTVTWADLNEVQQVVIDICALSWRPAGGGEPDINAAVANGWRRRERYRAERAQQLANEAAAKPWQCEHCDRRFKTERGNNQHERRCRAASRRRAEQGAGSAGWILVAADPKEPLPPM